MAYTAPYIDETGLHLPTYADIRDELISQMKQIFGEDIYITEDTQDYQQISVLAKKIYDTNSLAMLVYNNRTPNTAVGVGLDNLCALVGITRKPARYSKVMLTITGTPSTVINGGKASDGTYAWDLPESVTIPDSGSISVLCTCETPGRITVAANTITIIETPTYGWTSVTNNYTVTGENLGDDAESDAELRGRFARATESPSSTVFESMISAIEAIEGVERVKSYENDTNNTSSEGFPPHSVTFVIEGGEDEAIATEIYFKKTPGCYTNGTTAVTLTSLSGNENIIRFYRPSYKTVYVRMNVTKLASWNDDMENQIKQAVVDYINNLGIADSVYTSAITATALSQMQSLANPSYTITLLQMSTNGSTYSANDISLAFNEAAQTTVARITVNYNA